MAGLESSSDRDTMCHSNDNLVENEQSAGRKNVFIGYIIIALFNICFVVAFVCAQMSGSTMDVFEMNTVRFITQFVIMFAILVIEKRVPMLDVRYWYLIVIVAVSDLVMCSCNMVVAGFMPVGNVTGVLTASFIIYSLPVDLYYKVVSKLSVFAALLACVGIVLLIQPWNVGIKAPITNSTWVSPCEQMSGGENSVNMTYKPSLTFSIANQLFAYVPRHVIGYLIVMFAGVTVTISGYSTRCLLNVTSASTIIFWMAVIEGAVSIMITSVLKYHTGSFWLALPGSSLCILFTFICTTFMALQTICMYYSYKYLPVYHVAMGTAPITVLLYICQRTFLKLYQPGNANAVEIAGTLFISLATMMGPLLNTLNFKMVLNKKIFCTNSKM